ncbi:MAG: hypothetical protein K8R74_00380 [Bacteroidales bacterium]|nr:hypothetical protein [Bacteroidales bacterium]
MHPNVKKGQLIHKEHFKAIVKNGEIAPEWEVWLVDSALPGTKQRPDWILINQSEKRAFIIDLTTKYNPRHYKKGLQYKTTLQKLLDESWDVVYIEDYWLNATMH